MKNIIILLSITILISCGRATQEPPEGFTSVMFSSGQDTRATLNRGVMIYALNLTQGKSRTTSAGSISALNDSMTLPNGEYIFYALGFEATPGPENLNSDRYCGVSNNGSPILLSGGNAVVNITLSQTDDCPSIFGTTAFRSGNTLKSVTFNICTNNTVSSCLTPFPTPSGYIQISIINYDDLTNQETSLGISGCYGDNSLSGIKLPLGSNFKIGLRKWTGASCTGSVGNLVILNSGLPNLPDFTSNDIFGINNGGSPLHFFIRQNQL